MFGLLIAIIYLSFISLGLPDSLLGAAWPVMRIQFDAPLSYAGIISMIICGGTIVSSLLSDRLTKKFGTGLVTAVSVTITAAALFGFSMSDRLWLLIVLAVPYGLGAGGVDASLNNYVALHLKSRHMSWLHCMWGVGAAISPNIMSFALTHGSGWQQGYLIVSIIQIVLSLIIFISLPLWKRRAPQQTADGSTVTTDAVVGSAEPIKIKNILRISGAIPCFICFFCYCSLEQTTMLWASSYMIYHNAISVETAASLAGLFFIGITVGRGVNGFLTFKFCDRTLIRAGQIVIAVGIAFIVIPNEILTYIGFALIGLGCAPIYPSIIHMTPELFGADKSQAMIGVQMASAYLGSCFAPPLYGLIANHVSQAALPIYLVIFLALMIVMHEIVVKKTKGNKPPVVDIDNDRRSKN